MSLLSALLGGSLLGGSLLASMWPAPHGEPVAPVPAAPAPAAPAPIGLPAPAVFASLGEPPPVVLAPITAPAPVVRDPITESSPVVPTGLAEPSPVVPTGLAEPEPAEPTELAEPAPAVPTASAEPAPAEPTAPAVPTASAAPTQPAPVPKIPPPTVLRPELVPAVRATPTTSPRPAPAFVVAPPRPPVKTHRARLPRGWAVDLSGGTVVPLAVGVATQLEIPQRLLVALETGATPGLYVDAIHRVAGLGRTTPAAAIVRGTARRALVVRVAVGVRPLRRRGLELRGGYTVTTLGGAELSPTEIDELNARGADIDTDRVLVQSTIDCLHADIGWRWVVRDHLLVRAALGYVQSLGARMFAVSDLTTAAERNRLGAALARVADAGATAAIRAPTATVHLGYRF